MYENYSIPWEWKLIITLMWTYHKDIKKRQKKWGDLIPIFLIDTTKEYLPHEPVMLLNIYGVMNVVLDVGKSLA